MNDQLMDCGVTALSSAETANVNGGEVTTTSSFAHDAAEWVATAAAFYAGMIVGFFGG